MSGSGLVWNDMIRVIVEGTQMTSHYFIKFLTSPPPYSVTQKGSALIHTCQNCHASLDTFSPRSCLNHHQGSIYLNQFCVGKLCKRFKLFLAGQVTHHIMWLIKWVRWLIMSGEIRVRLKFCISTFDSNFRNFYKVKQVAPTDWIFLQIKSVFKKLQTQHTSKKKVSSKEQMIIEIPWRSK